MTDHIDTETRLETRSVDGNVSPIVRLEEDFDLDEISKQLLGGLGNTISTLASALRPKEDAEQVEAATDLLYRDWWPLVEVTVAIIEVTRFELVDMSFDVEFEIYLDWKDPQLCRGIHYEYVAERGVFEMTSAIRACKSDMNFFNPKLVITNSHTSPEEVDVFPQIVGEVSEGDGDDSRDVPWLCKKFRFAGTLSCRHIDARRFPFDINCLYIKFACPDMCGLTSQGRVRRIRFAEPSLSMNSRLRKKRFPYFATARLPDGRSISAGMRHMWRFDPDGGETHKIGEMRVIAVGGSLESEGTGYSFAMVLLRQWYPRYFFDIVIYNLQTMSACFSHWVPFNVDMFASRMSITLTVLLTVVGVSTTRPPVIEKLPYSTLHDSYGQLMVFSVLLIGVANLVIFVNCWGVYRPGLDYYDSSLHMEISNFRTNGILGEWWCKEGEGFLGCGASNLDCMVLMFTLCSLASLVVYAYVSSQMSRIDRILRIKHELDSQGDPLELECDPIERQSGVTNTESAPIAVQIPVASTSYSKLVMCDEKGEFHLVPMYGVVTFAKSVTLLPGFWPFWLSWRWCRTLGMHGENLRSQNRCCRLLCCCCRHRKMSVDQDGDGKKDDDFHPTDAERLLRDVEDFNRKRKSNKLAAINQFQIKLTPLDTFYVIDVGSGEMGFYSYWLDEKRRVKSSTHGGKLKYEKGLTFVDQFMDNDGAESLKNEIVERFQLGHHELHDVSGPPLLNPIAFDLPHTPGISRDVGFDIPEPPEVAVAHRPSTASSWPVRPQTRKITLCLTGANRQMLTNGEGRKDLENFHEAMRSLLKSFNVELSVYSPEDVDEALFELAATEWVVQHGDLCVKEVKLGKVYQILQRGNERGKSAWEEISEAFTYLDAGDDLKDAFYKAGAAKLGDGLPQSVSCKSFYKEFQRNDRLLRALVRAKLFSGTLSAGSGSSQVTFRSSVRTGSNSEVSQVYSLPLGNRTPLVKMEISCDQEDDGFLSKKFPRTRKLALELLCPEDEVKIECRNDKPRTTVAAWVEDGDVTEDTLRKWRILVRTCAEERELPTRRRGLFVGISAIFYASKAAQCHNKLLRRDDFLKRLKEKIDELLGRPKGSGRELANLTLVYELVTHVLHHTAQIVCKREWKVGEDCGESSDFVATWTLGMYLKHSGAVSQPLQI